MPRGGACWHKFRDRMRNLGVPILVWCNGYSTSASMMARIAIANHDPKGLGWRTNAQA
jgi:hypothetical protein